MNNNEQNINDEQEKDIKEKETEKIRQLVDQNCIDMKSQLNDYAIKKNY